MNNYGATQRPHVPSISFRTVIGQGRTYCLPLRLLFTFLPLSHPPCSLHPPSMPAPDVNVEHRRQRDGFPRPYWLQRETARWLYPRILATADGV